MHQHNFLHLKNPLEKLHYDDYTPPDTVIVYFKNQLAIRKNGATIDITCIQSFPEIVEALKSDFNESIVIANDEELKRNYRDKNGYDYSNLFSEKSFQDALLKGSGITKFFKVEDKRIRITQNTFSLTYSLSLANKDKEHIVDIFQYLGIVLSTGHSPHLWILINRFLRNVTIQDEIRPDHIELTKSLLEVKSHDLERYSSISADFSNLFPNVSFNAQPAENRGTDQTTRQEERIEFREKNLFTGKLNTFHLRNSAGGYAEVLYLLLQKSQAKDGVLVLDEPALRLHPNVIRHLNRILAESERQIVLVTHSPYFVDISSLGPDRNLVYIRKDKYGSSKAYSKPKYQESSHLGLRSYVFNPDVLFSSYNILVEGASDASSFYAISDSLGSLFEHFNILVVNSNGDGNIDPYIEFMTNYQIPYIAMVDIQYKGNYSPTDNFVILDNKLEHELVAAGWTGKMDSSIDPDEAYYFVLDAIQRTEKQKIRNTKIGQIFDKTFREIGEDPDKLWNISTKA